MTRRLIKFRFWCEAAKGFVQNYNYNGAVDDLFNNEDPLLFPTQYTGCNDRDEKEIWEGDIVEYEVTIAGSQTKKILGVVEYIDGAFFIKTINHVGTWSFLWLHDSYSYNHKLKVIGNKFENKKLMENSCDISDVIGSWSDKICEEFKNACTKEYAFYHKPTKLWVYFLPNYDERQVISLGLKNDATTIIKNDIEHFTGFLKICSFNGIKNYAVENFLEFELKQV